MDETLAAYCPMNNFTYAPEGDNRVQILGQNDKRGETLTVSITRAGEILPFATIWSGKTPRSLPKFESPPGFLNSFAGVTGSRVNSLGTVVTSSNKWQNRKTISEFIEKIIAPYLKYCRSHTALVDEMKLFPKNTQALMIWDHHWSHEDEVATVALSTIQCDAKFISAKATDLFSALDVGINKSIKSFFRTCFESYCSSAILKQLNDGIKPANVKVNLRISKLKPVAAKWIAECYSHLIAKDDLVENAWRGTLTNLEQKLGQKLALPIPIPIIQRKYVAEYLQQLLPKAATASHSGSVTPHPASVAPTPSNKPDSNESDNSMDSDPDETPTNEADNSINPDNVTSPDEVELGSTIKVWWDDADGKRWEEGVVKEKKKKSCRNIYIITYKFLEQRRLRDPDVEENLTGKSCVKWLV